MPIASQLLVIAGITLDLDDTLWPVSPAIEHAETTLSNWLIAHYPHIASQWTAAKIRTLRDEVYVTHNTLWHDFTTLRRITLEKIMCPFGCTDTEITQALQVFFTARNQVTLYPDALSTLQALFPTFKLASLTNGNADLHQIGLAPYFSALISARDVGVTKPHPFIFQHACHKLQLEPACIAHVGDDPELDVIGAQRAGMISVWLNREQQEWPSDEILPDIIITSLTDLYQAIHAWNNSK